MLDNIPRSLEPNLQESDLNFEEHDANHEYWPSLQPLPGIDPARHPVLDAQIAKSQSERFQIAVQLRNLKSQSAQNRSQIASKPVENRESGNRAVVIVI